MEISLGDTAKIFGVSESKIFRWVQEGLPAFLINGRYRFHRVDLLEWAHHRKLPIAALYQWESQGLGLVDILEGNIHYEVPGSDVQSVMAAVAHLLPLRSAKDKALAARALSHREGLGSTGIGDGVALPHARGPLIFPVERPLLVLCFLARPVSFNAPDGKPVQIVWALLSPTVRDHLALLAKISGALRDAIFREALIRKSPASRILARLKEIS